MIVENIEALEIRAQPCHLYTPGAWYQWPSPKIFEETLLQLWSPGQDICHDKSSKIASSQNIYLVLHWSYFELHISDSLWSDFLSQEPDFRIGFSWTTA